MPSGQSAIDFLAKGVEQHDPAESSHWNKYHSTFHFTGNGFKGLQGFGGWRKPRGMIFHQVERFLQSRFRIMGGAEFSSQDNLAKEIAAKQNRNYDLDLLRQALTLSLLRESIPDIKRGELIGCVIGDGFSSMTSLLIASNSAAKVVLVNLTKTLLVDLWYLRLWMGPDLFEDKLDLVTNKEELQIALDKPNDRSLGVNRVIAIRATDHELISNCPIDFAINIASMQEMNPRNILEYFNDLRRPVSCGPLYFYCSNRQEKYLPDGTITRFLEYSWLPEDQILIDELAPWHQEYYSFKPSLFRNYDGPIQHRLAVLSKI